MDSLLQPGSGGLHTPAPFQQSELSPEQAAEACIVTAEKLEAAGHRREAIGLYEKAREHDAEAIDYSRRLAVLYDQRGDVANAAREYHKAIADDPENPDLLNDFGYFHLTQGDLTAAETKFRSAISLEEDHQRAWTNLGIVLAYQGQYQESLAAFTRVVGPAAAHSNVGAILAKQGNTEQAKREFRQALVLNAGLEQPRAWLAQLEQSRPLDDQPARQP
jgi:Tfp pilus assembly protein PilF